MEDGTYRYSHPSQHLRGDELLVLQLLALGYPREQLARLLGRTAFAIRELEESACAVLGAGTVEEALELARRWRLIL